MIASDVSGLLAALEAEQFDVGVDSRVRTLALLAELSARGVTLDDPDTLELYLRPLFARTPGDFPRLRACIVRARAPASENAQPAPTGRRFGPVLRWAMVVVVAGLLLAVLAHRISATIEQRALPAKTSQPQQQQPGNQAASQSDIAAREDSFMSSAAMRGGSPTLQELSAEGGLLSDPQVAAKALGVTVDTPIPVYSKPITKRLIEADLAAAIARGDNQFKAQANRVDETAGRVAEAVSGYMSSAERKIVDAVSQGYRGGSDRLSGSATTIGAIGSWVRVRAPDAATMPDNETARIAVAEALNAGDVIFIEDAPWSLQQAPNRGSSPALATWLRINARLLAVAAVVLTLLALWLWIVTRTRGFLESRRHGERNNIVRLALRGRLPDGPPRRDLSSAASHLGRRRLRSTTLDVHGMVRTTASANGLFTPVFRKLWSTPRYLMLIDRKSRHDHLARQMADFADRMKGERVDIIRRFFEAAPDRIRVDQGQPSTPLSRLAAAESARRLILVGDAETMTALPGWRRSPWAAVLGHWRQAVFLPASPLGPWDDGTRLAQTLKMPLARAPSFAPADLARSITDPTSGHAPNVDTGAPYPSLLNPDVWNADRAPGKAQIADLIEALQDRLGYHGFRWLKACAIYPTLQWDLTIAIGQALKDETGRPVGDEARLGRLSALPWMRSGDLPAWLREQLIGMLEPGDASTVRSLLADVMEQIEPTDQAAAGPIFSFGVNGIGALQQDTSFARFVARPPGQRSPSGLEATRKLDRMLNSSFKSRFGWFSGLILAAATLLGALAWRTVEVWGGTAPTLVWAMTLVLVVCASVVSGFLAATGLARALIVQSLTARLGVLVGGFMSWLRIVNAVLFPHQEGSPDALQAFRPSRLPRPWNWFVNPFLQLEYAFYRARISGRPEDNARVRILVVLAFNAVLFGLIGGGAVFSALFANERTSGQALPATAKADLVDRNGQLLAINVVAYNLFLDPTEVTNPVATKEALLKILPRLAATRVETILGGARRRYLTGPLSPRVRRDIEALGLAGLSFDETTQRTYPQGKLAAQLIGFSDPGGQGLQGAEKSLQDELRQGYIDNQPVALALDMRVQAVLEDELAAAVQEFTPKNAAGLVVNVHTGEIIAMASQPTFDLNRYSEVSEEERRNRATAQVYEMGSTFKAFTVAAGLDSGVATMDSTFDASVPFKMGYRTIHDFHGIGRVLTLSEVFNHSSNIGTARLAVGIGPARLKEYFDRLGLTRRPSIDLSEAAYPLTPQKWDDDTITSVAFGHGINVSPAALAQAMCTVVNGGASVPLTILKKPEGYSPSGYRVFSESTSRSMLQLLRSNVVSGTGLKADVPGLSVGGKTGTGEKYDPETRGYSRTRQVASFAAVFPTDGPLETNRYLVFILLDEPTGYPRTGSWVAAPAVGRVIDRSAAFLGVPRRRTP